MAVLRDVEVCLAPSAGLSRGEASTMGNIVEQVILRDYLSDTTDVRLDAFTEPRPTLTHWWDSGIKEHYKQILIERHPEKERRIRALQELKVPDISTWNGEYRRDGKLVSGSRGPRTELYEVKPGSPWGKIAADKKLNGIAENFRELSLKGDYQLGTWYPDPPTKRLHFRDLPYVAASFQYRLKRLVKAAALKGGRVVIRDVVLQIQRQDLEPAVVYYKVCVRLSIDHNGEDQIAKEVVRRLFRAMTTRLPKELAAAERAFAEALTPYENQRPKPATTPDATTQAVLTAIAEEEQYRIRAVQIAPELRNAVASLGKTLFTRLRGLPGERYLVCCDDVYLQNEIIQPRTPQMARTMQLLQVRPPIPVQYHVAAAGAMVKVDSALLATAETLSTLVKEPATIFTAAEHWKKTYAWLEAHPVFTLIVGSAVIYMTAVAVASGGATAAAAMYGLDATGAGIAAAELGAELAPEYGLARALAGPAIESTALPALEQATTQRITAEAARELTAREANALLEAEIRASSREIDRIVARQAVTQLRQQGQAALAPGNRTMAAAAMRVAVGAPTSGPPDEAAMSVATPLAVETGYLHLLKLRDDFPDNGQLPAEAEKFTLDHYTLESPGPLINLSGTPAPRRMAYLGLLECL